MSGRLLHWPNGLKPNFMEPLSGPRAIGAASNQSTSGFVQTVAAPFGLWRWRFNFPGNMRGQAARRYRGWITGLHGGANATRVPFSDPDGLTRADMGLAQPGNRNAWWRRWGNGRAWGDGGLWGFTPPLVAVAEAAAKGASEIKLATTYWGGSLGDGDFVGFAPFHFGLYMVTEGLPDNRYRIWPPLRKAIATTDSATLRPTLAMRMESEESANVARGPAFLSGPSITMVEVLDADVRAYFTA